MQYILSLKKFKKNKNCFLQGKEKKKKKEKKRKKKCEGPCKLFWVIQHLYKM
jgi:hypothetical protein